MNDVVKINNLSFSYNQNIVLNNISLNIQQGEYIGLIGSNGSGKSTLIKLILNILHPNKGEILLWDTPSLQFKKWNDIGYIPQKVNTFNRSFPATVEEIVALNLYSEIGIFKFGNKKHRSKVHNALEKVEMSDFKSHPIGNLSGGQLQRVFIAKVLVNEPKLLILDEPTVGMDERSEEDIFALLKKFNKELLLTILMVTHDIERIKIEASRIITLGF